MPGKEASVWIIQDKKRKEEKKVLIFYRSPKISGTHLKFCRKQTLKISQMSRIPEAHLNFQRGGGTNHTVK